MKRRRLLRRLLVTLASTLTGLGLAFALFALWMISRVTAKPHPEPTQEHPAPARPELVLSAESADIGRKMRLYALQTGDTEVPYGQFYSGLEGWVGARAAWKTLFGGKLSQVPVGLFAVVHPSEGVVLVDAGLSRAQTEPGYYSFLAGGVNAIVWRGAGSRIPVGQDLLTQLRSLGIDSTQVRHVVVSHLHEDHIGELTTFPEATIHVSRREWEDRWRIAYEPTLAEVRHWDHFEYDSGRLLTFEATKDLLGDGTIVLLPTPGHSVGHTSVLVNLGDSAAILTGDAVYTMRHLDPETIASLNYYGDRGLATYEDSIRRMLGLQERIPGLVILPPHDPFSYTSEVQAFLADGVLSPEEREELLAHQRSLYDASGRLRPEAVPRYVKGGPGGGRVVAEPM